MKRASASISPLQVLVPGPHIEGHTIECCARTRTILLDRILLTFSRIDYRLMMHILHSAAKKEPFVPIEELLPCFNHSQDNLPRSLSRHLSAIRPHLRLFGLEIASVRKQGYALIWKPPDTEPAVGAG